MLKYNFNVIAALKENGYSTYRIRKEGLIPEGSVQRLRKGTPIGWETLETCCRLLNCQPGDILRFDFDEDNEKKTNDYTPPLAVDGEPR